MLTAEGKGAPSSQQWTTHFRKVARSAPSDLLTNIQEQMHTFELIPKKGTKGSTKLKDK